MPYTEPRTGGFDAIYDATGELPHARMPIEPGLDISVLIELARRMEASAEAARRKHAAWNPMECVTQLRLEIETGKYRG